HQIPFLRASILILSSLSSDNYVGIWQFRAAGCRCTQIIQPIDWPTKDSRFCCGETTQYAAPGFTFILHVLRSTCAKWKFGRVRKRGEWFLGSSLPVLYTALTACPC